MGKGQWALPIPRGSNKVFVMQDMKFALLYIKLDLTLAIVSI
uniref:Uncharacterized protein n=1 Tax=Anguilla anguilla TaxID=7936 RepID=A0A0E9UQH7_ANGAN